MRVLWEALHAGKVRHPIGADKSPVYKANNLCALLQID